MGVVNVISRNSAISSDFDLVGGLPRSYWTSATSTGIVFGARARRAVEQAQRGGIGPGSDAVANARPAFHKPERRGMG